MQQRSDEWFAARCGKVTASRVYDIMPGAKGAYLASRKNYMAEKVCEILTGQPAESFASAAMQWGTDMEPLARSAYEAKTGAWVTEYGFRLADKCLNLGCSPDGLVHPDGGIEIKCPNTATHIATITGAPIDQRYIYQMQTAMLIFGRAWWDFVSFDPRLPDHLQLYIQRVYADHQIHGKILSEAWLFVEELEKTLRKLKDHENSDN